MFLKKYRNQISILCLVAHFAALNPSITHAANSNSAYQSHSQEEAFSLSNKIIEKAHQQLEFDKGSKVKNIKVKLPKFLEANTANKAQISFPNGLTEDHQVAQVWLEKDGKEYLIAVPVIIER
jgi:hypothetical protein